MKKYPYPDKKLKNSKEVRAHFEDLFTNAMVWMMISGYQCYILMPKHQDYHEATDAGMSVNVNYPYKTFKVSIQKSSIEACLKEDRDSPIWENIERSVIHELGHVLSWEICDLAQRRYVMRTDIENADEKLVDHLANFMYPIIKENRRLNLKRKK